MVHEHTSQGVTDEDRREFLKVLGVTGAATAGGLTIREVREGASAATAEELAPIGAAIEADLEGAIDAGYIGEQQGALADAASALPVSLERGLPAASREPREEFAAVAEQGRPIYDHLRDVGFFASTTEHLPAFDLDVLSSSMETVVASEEIVGMLEAFGLTGEQGVDLLATVIGNADELAERHWVATEDLPGDAIKPGEAFPTVTQAAAGGVLLWLEDLDLHLYQKAVLIDEAIHADAVWHGQSMAAGFYLMSEAARQIGEGAGTLSESELGALLTTSFAVQAISQGRLPENVYWLTEEMRKPSALR